MRPLIRSLGIPADRSAEQEEMDPRILLATRTLDYLKSPDFVHQPPATVLASIKERYKFRLNRLCNRAEGILASQRSDKALTQFQQLQENVIRFERTVIEQLQQTEYTNKKALRKVENELELEEARLALDRL